MARATPSWMAMEEEMLWGQGPLKIAVIPIQGTISGEDREDGFPSARRSTTPNRIERYVRRIVNDPSVRGALLLINSPGGSATASDEVWAQLKTLAATKRHIAAYIGDVGASGAYYAACASEYIVAAPASITGSIGVIWSLTELHEAMQKIGVKITSLTSGPFKDAGSPYRPFAEADRTYLEGILRDTFERFKNVVAQGRNMTPDEVARVADGRVFTSSQALEHKLIDAVGYRHVAVAEIKRLCGVTDATFVQYREKRSTLDLLSRVLPLKLEHNITHGLTDDILSALGLNEHGPLYLWRP